MKQRGIIPYENLKKELSLIKDIPIAKEIRDKAEALRRYVKSIGEGLEVQNKCAEIKIRAERKAGELLIEMPKHPGNRPLHDERTKLKDLHVSEIQSHRWQKIASLPDESFEAYLNQVKSRYEELTTNGILKLLLSRHTSDDSYEWNTPENIIESARKVMGSIDIDPATNEAAQEMIKAAIYYTRESDGLKHVWKGKLWLNPPYSMPEIEDFINKTVEEYNSKNLSQFIILTNNSTDTEWFHNLLKECLVCFTYGRVPFWLEDGSKLAVRQGQAIFYKGRNEKDFVNEFSKYGQIVERIKNDKRY